MVSLAFTPAVAWLGLLALWMAIGLVVIYLMGGEE